MNMTGLISLVLKHRIPSRADPHYLLSSLSYKDNEQHLSQLVPEFSSLPLKTAPSAEQAPAGPTSREVHMGVNT